MTFPRLSVRAYAIAATLQPRDVEPLFAERAARVKVTKTHVVVRYGETSWAVAYDFGAVVFLDVEEAERERVLGLLSASEPRAMQAETYTLEIRPEARGRAHFDHVVLPELEQRAVELVSLVIAQSVGMEYYESEVDALVGEMERLARELADRGRFQTRGGQLLSFIGRGMATRTQVVHTLALLDAPAMVWESEHLDRLYRELRGTFEIEDRYSALDHKLRMIQDNLELFVDMTRDRRGLVLEIAVIALIAAELILGLLRH